jgi:hypothetical protein
MFKFKQWFFHQSVRDQLNRELYAMETALAQGVSWRLARLNHALQKGNAAAVIQIREEIEQFLEAAQATSALPFRVRVALIQMESKVVEQVVPVPPPPIEAVPTYWVSSATLAEAHAYLTQRLPGTNQEPEWMLAVSGLRRNHVRTLEHLIEVKLATQSGGRASFDIEDFTRITVKLHEHGQALHAVFHSHRFAGPPHPSSTDDHLQRQLEEGGYPAIQAIFSEDGYVRFFTSQRRFVVEVHGKGVQPVDREGYLYRIVHFDTLPHPAYPAQESGRGGSLRPLPARAGC